MPQALRKRLECRPVATPPVARVPCPFVYADGRRCTGHVVRIEAYKADLVWQADEEGRWRFDFQPRSHYHLYCSLKGNHAGFKRQDPFDMKDWLDRLPEALQALITGVDVAPAHKGVPPAAD